MNLDTLFTLIGCHSTPGDEREVAQALQRCFTAAGLQVHTHGQYAISATVPTAAAATGPRVLVCAHMDSPGFAVQSIAADHCTLTPLGGAHFPAEQVAGNLKLGAQHLPVQLHQALPPDEDDAPRFTIPTSPGVRAGDRVCYAAAPRQIQHAGLDCIVAPFLDNRVGCWLLTELLSRPELPQLPVQLILGATGTEEFGGFGARVLASAVQADLVIVLDATYEAPEQNVHIGHGPVLTLADASALLSCRLRDTVLALLANAGIAMQTEVYNYSGTDARGFPHQGQTCPILPLLIASTGNHTPSELLALPDAAAVLASIICLADHATAISQAARLL